MKTFNPHHLPIHPIRNLTRSIGDWIAPMIFLLVALIFSTPSFAQIKITAVERASASTINSNGTAIIRGGVAGLQSACDDTDADATCNNCSSATSTTSMCNTNRIHTNLELRITFKVEGEVSGILNFGYYNGSTYTPLTLESGSTTTTLAKDSEGVAVIKWSTLCGATSISATCSTVIDGTTNSSASLTFYIGLMDSDDTELDDQNKRASFTAYITSYTTTSTSNDAIFPESEATNRTINAFYAQAGDEKIFIVDPTPGTNCPDTGITNNDIVKFRVFYREDTNTRNVVLSDPSFDMNLDSTCNITSENFIDGLTNGATYVLRGAGVDEANNVLYFQGDSAVPSSDTSIFTGNCQSVTSIVADANCEYAAQPGDVQGLLNEKFQCFIASAAFGSPFAPMVQDLRKFRDRFLMSSSWGKKFVHNYYNLSPPMARWIENHPNAKFAARVLLLPSWAFSKIALKTNLWFATAIAFLTMAFLVFSVWRLIRFLLSPRSSIATGAKGAFR
jgi:hypothetical protein